MPPSHVVQQGEHISSIAEHYGFPDYRVLWNHPKNRQLKEARQNPNVLFPGDELFVPDRDENWQTCQTEHRYVFQMTRTVPKLRLVLKDFADRPLAQLSCELQVEDKAYSLTSDQNGKIEQIIAPSARNATLTVKDANGGIVMHMHLKIGDLDPVEERSGWQARLNNLGYDAGEGEEADEARLRAAVEEFQREYGLQVDGNCGPNTQAKLKQVHGC